MAYHTPNFRLQRYKKYRLEGMTQYAAARKAGYGHFTARNAYDRIERRIDMSTELEMAGLTDRKLAEFAAKGLEAERTFVTEDGLCTGADWVSRFKFFDKVCELKGLKGKNGDKEGQTNNINIGISAAFSNIIKEGKERDASGFTYDELLRRD